MACQWDKNETAESVWGNKSLLEKMLGNVWKPLEDHFDQEIKLSWQARELSSFSVNDGKLVKKTLADLVKYPFSKFRS